MHTHPNVATPHRSEPPETTGPSRGAVVLDIGADRGALVVRTGSEFEACEIEIRRPPARWDGTHVAVRARTSGGAPVFAAVFGGLREGDHELRLRPVAIDGEVHRVEVRGGEVTEITWPHDRRFM